MRRVVPSRVVVGLLVAVLAAGCGGSATPTDTSTIDRPSPDLTTTGDNTDTTATPTSTVPAPVSTAPPPTVSLTAPSIDVCTIETPVESAGEVCDPDLVEISGVVASRTHPGVFWVHNDSGGGPFLYALDRTGAVVSRVELVDTLALDWEDLAIGPAPDGDGDALYVGDIGDNLGIRSFVSIFRIREPDPTVGEHRVVDVERFRIAYPDGPEDAEGLAVDAVTGTLAIATKTGRGGSILTVPLADLDPADPVTATVAAVLDLGASITALDISVDGGAVVARGYESVWGWSRTVADLSEVLVEPPCALPAPSGERQGEAIASVDGGYLTISEGTGQSMNFVNP